MQTQTEEQTIWHRAALPDDHWHSLLAKLPAMTCYIILKPQCVGRIQGKKDSIYKKKRIARQSGHSQTPQTPKSPKCIAEV